LAKCRTHKHLLSLNAAAFAHSNRQYPNPADVLSMRHVRGTAVTSSYIPHRRCRKCCIPASSNLPRRFTQPALAVPLNEQLLLHIITTQPVTAMTPAQQLPAVAAAAAAEACRPDPQPAWPCQSLSNCCCHIPCHCNDSGTAAPGCCCCCC
jgi:hypothetical protein